MTTRAEAHIFVDNTEAVRVETLDVDVLGSCPIIRIGSVATIFPAGIEFVTRLRDELTRYIDSAPVLTRLQMPRA